MLDLGRGWLVRNVTPKVAKSAVGDQQVWQKRGFAPNISIFPGDPPAKRNGYSSERTEALGSSSMRANR